VQRREDQLDVQRLSRDLASAYLRAFGLHERPGAAARKDGRKQPRDRRRPGGAQPPAGRARRRD
jgi:hypothetical protein